MSMNIPILPPTTEWDFSQDGKRDWEAQEWETCFYYEYARESEVCRKSVELCRKSNPNGSFKDYLSAVFKPFQRSKLPKNRYPYALFNYCPPGPEWPKQAFLSIPSTERRKRLSMMPTRKSTALVQRDLNAIIATYAKHAAPTLDVEQMQAFVKGDYEDPVSNKRATIATGLGKELVCFEVDWRDGNAEIARCFKAWLDRAKPLLGKSVWYRADSSRKLVPSGETRTVLGGTVREHRGKGSPTAHFQAELKALGAWRIWRAFGGNWAKIEIATASRKFTLGRQFAHQPAWTRARRIAEQVIADFNV